MNTIFKHNDNAKYSTKDLKGGPTGNSFSALNVYLNEKGSSAKIQLLNIFKDYHIVAYSGPTTVSYAHGKYRPKLSEYFKMY